jgi:hypothetical protein
VQETGARHSPANDVLAVSISRIRSEVANDVEVGFSRDHVGCERLPRAGEDLHGRRADSPVQLEGTHTEVDCVRGSGNTVGVQGMASGGLADDVLVRGINEGDEGTLALEFERAELSECRECGIAGAATLSQGTFDACADRLDTSASKVSGEGELGM